MSEVKYYGFDLSSDKGGLGGVIHSLMLSAHYAIKNGMKPAIVEEGKSFPRLNGSVNDLGTPEVEWHSYFKSLPLIKRDQCVAVWSNCPAGWDPHPPEGYDRLKWYSDLMKTLFVLRSDVQKEVDSRVRKSGFDPSTDVVLHIRRTDKIFPIQGSQVESSEIPLDLYVKEVLKVHTKGDRVFLCTDDHEIRQQVRYALASHKIKVVWDENESATQYHVAYMQGKLKKSEALEDNLNTFKNLYIMVRAKYLIGGRMSYFFRSAELLRHPLPSTNLKDNDLFGRAEYDDAAFPFYRVISPVSSERASERLKRDYIVTIPGWLSDKIGAEIQNDLKWFKPEWWMHAVKPDGHSDPMYFKHNDPELPKAIERAKASARAGHFCYCFKRTFRDHYANCGCVICKLDRTFRSPEVKKMLAKLVGSERIEWNETFGSLYQQGDFLTLHHDKNKGDYTFILSLTPNWNPVHGGHTHFWDRTKEEIYKTVSPRMGTLTVFKLSPERQMDHFVSEVTGPGDRYSFT